MSNLHNSDRPADDDGLYLTTTASHHKKDSKDSPEALKREAKKWVREARKDVQIFEQGFARIFQN